jgi:hypothetical protein
MLSLSALAMTADAAPLLTLCDRLLPVRVILLVVARSAVLVPARVSLALGRSVLPIGVHPAVLPTSIPLPLTCRTGAELLNPGRKVRIARPSLAAPLAQDPALLQGPPRRRGRHRLHMELPEAACGRRPLRQDAAAKKMEEKLATPVGEEEGTPEARANRAGGPGTRSAEQCRAHSRERRSAGVGTWWGTAGRGTSNPRGRALARPLLHIAGLSGADASAVPKGGDARRAQQGP